MTDSIILQNFNPMMVAMLEQYGNSQDITDNNERADYIVRYLSQFGFSEVGCGTNRVVVKKDCDDTTVYKIALDKRGYKDNILENVLSRKLQPYATVCFDNIGVISAQERVNVMTKTDMYDNINTVRSILMNIGMVYVVHDVGPNAFMNWGFRDNGEIVILDYAYITPITKDMVFKCKAKQFGKPKRCGGQLIYTENYDKFMCMKCGAKFAISDIIALPEDELVFELNSYDGNMGVDESLYPQIERELKQVLGTTDYTMEYDEFGLYTGGNQ